MFRKLLGVLFCGMLLWGFSVQAETPPQDRFLKIGDSFAYTSFARFAGPYKNGWQMAVDEINESGGVCFDNSDCLKIEVISVDHGDSPEQGVRMVEGLVERDNVDVLAGTVLTNVTNAIGSYAGQKQIPIFTVWSSVLAEKGPQNDYMFSMMPVEPHSMAAAELAADMPIKKWATIGPDIAWGRTGNALFKKHLKALRPDVEFVAEQWPALMKFNATAEFSALRQAEPAGIFSTLFGTDLFSFIREGNRLNFFEGKTVIATELTQRAHMNVIGEDIVQGDFYGTGYPAEGIKSDTHKKFYDDYLTRYGEPPELYSLAGYNIYKVIADAVRRAGSTDKNVIRDALRDANIETPMGDLKIFPSNHRADFGVWLGHVNNGDMQSWDYYPAHKYIGKQ